MIGILRGNDIICRRPSTPDPENRLHFEDTATAKDRQVTQELTKLFVNYVLKRYGASVDCKIPFMGKRCTMMIISHNRAEVSKNRECYMYVVEKVIDVVVAKYSSSDNEKHSYCLMAKCEGRLGEDRYEVLVQVWADMETRYLTISMCPFNEDTKSHTFGFTSTLDYGVARICKGVKFPSDSDIVDYVGDIVTFSKKTKI